MRADLPEEQIHTLLNTPHQIYLINNIIRSKIEAFKSQITLGNINPAGEIVTAVSIDLSTDVLYSIAKDIVESIESKKTEFAIEHDAFISSLK